MDEETRRRAVKYLQWSKMIRSVGQGALAVAFSLYLKDLGWSATGIGLLLSSGGILNAGLSLVIGAASDRTGRKSYVLWYEVVTLVAAVVMMLYTGWPAIVFGCLFVGIGRNQSGVPGPMNPAEQAWIAEVVPPLERGMVYSTNSALGFFGMGTGAVIVGQMKWWQTWLPGIQSYQPLFLLVALSALGNFLLLWRTPGGEVVAAKDPAGTKDRGNAQGNDGAKAKAEVAAAAALGSEPAGRQRNVDAVTREENILMLKMAMVNALNGIAVGLTSPLLSYWFSLRFGVGADALGPVFALTFFITGLTTLFTGRLSQRIGIVRAVVSVRMASVIFMLLQPVIPQFYLASAVFTIRSALARSSVGARQALAVSLVRQERRGLASSLNGISMQLPNALGPSLAGAMMEAGFMALPFFSAAGLQFLFGVLYGRLFQRYDPVHRAGGETTCA
ncbi:MAG TPA: MFS transporter [Firmicutes bacterium]|nr:MFS transporter [Bacillota bacterium]